jgi:hypothetical protein
MPLQNAVKGDVHAYMPPLLLAYHALYNVGYGNHIQNGAHDCCGSAKAQGSKAKPTSRVSAAQSRQNEGQSDIKGGQQIAHLGPIEGTRHPQVLYLSHVWEVSFMPLRVG